MKRVVDKPYFTYSAFTAGRGGIEVRCPKCGGPGLVTLADMTASFMCTVCGEKKNKSVYVERYAVKGQCKSCERYFRVELTDPRRRHFSTLHVNCPHCGAPGAGKVQKTEEQYYSHGEITDGMEPFFGYPLYFRGSFDNKLIWAINREHLTYLIDYLEADLREKPAAYRRGKTQADHLPTFMKLAKNRESIVKALKKMRTEA
ncbi:MAG: hypothetical protein LBB57_04260 [Clostridiales Family XIII bacterium]|jgi:hypothetical protein|nr:hypothetical protein [Clostridiales Family XIII bacterium]